MSRHVDIDAHRAVSSGLKFCSAVIVPFKDLRPLVGLQCQHRNDLRYHHGYGMIAIGRNL